MIQFNLLPDVKKQYVKAKRTKRLITTVSLASSAAAIVVVFITYSFVNIAQKNHIEDLGKDISSLATTIQSTPDLNKILTAQNQLDLLPGLHSEKPELSRVFSYLTFVTPQTAKVSTLNLDAGSTSISLVGSADSIATINKFVDNIKAVTYTVNGEETSSLAPFSEVLTTLGADNESASFNINLVYDPIIFDNTREITMSLAGQQTSSEKVSEDGN